MTFDKDTKLDQLRADVAEEQGHRDFLWWLYAEAMHRLERAKAERILSAIFGTQEPTCPKAFALYRHEDVTGASGTGLVATGVQFDDGTTVVRWRGETPSTVVWPSLEAAEARHGHGGRTHVVWLQEDIVDTCAAVERDMEAKYGARVAELTRERDLYKGGQV